MINEVGPRVLYMCISLVPRSRDGSEADKKKPLGGVPTPSKPDPPYAHDVLTCQSSTFCKDQRPPHDQDH